MKRAILTAVLLCVCCEYNELFGDSLLFERVSDHCYYLQLKELGENVAVVVTEEGVVMVDPPQEPGLSIVVEALKRISTKPVRWVVFTDPSFSGTSGARYFAGQGAQLVASARLWTLANSQWEVPSEAAALRKTGMKDGRSVEDALSLRWFVFDHQMRLFPSSLEIRITALQYRAHTGGDVVLYVPEEKVLFVGDLYESARYPDIDISEEGSPLDWIDGLNQVVESIPALKPAIAEKSDHEEEPERTPEEQIAVVSAHGEVSNLQNMIDLLDACRKLRRYVTRAVRSGRTCESFLASSVSNPYKSYGNLAPYASQLYETLATDAKKSD